MKGTDAIEWIKKLLVDKIGGPKAMPLLKACKDTFLVVMSEIQDDIHYYNSKDFSTTGVETLNAKLDTAKCKDGFNGSSVEFPLENENNDLFHLTSIASGMMDLAKCGWCL